MNNRAHQEYKITKYDRQRNHKHNSFLIWFTGLSGSGKSTLANLVEVELHNLNISTYSLDGDNIRRGINENLDFSAEGRTENIRRVAEISNLFVEAGVVVLGAFISPYLKDRENIRKTVGAENFIEIYVNASLVECERRDVKGLYQKARAGMIKNMTGVTDPYEAPLNPDLEIRTDSEAIGVSLQKIMEFIYLKIEQNNG